MDVDVVYTWVDGAWPGYDDLLRRYAATRHDLNPNRYRDNLNLLKFSLRSLEQFVPWARQVIIVTCRPQIPSWLDPAAVRVVHHDELMAAADLPTFNSFAIVANLHRIRGLSRRFLYVEDDRLFGSPIQVSDLFDTAGRVLVYRKLAATASPRRRTASGLSPWNLALACSNDLLNRRYGTRTRRSVKHAPLTVDVESWQAMIDSWPDAFRRTSASRFRSAENVAPEHLYPHFLLEERLAVRVPILQAYRDVAYHPLNNVAAFQRVGLARLRRQKPKFFCLNDNFGERPSGPSVALAARFLEDWFSRPSRFEKREKRGKR